MTTREFIQHVILNCELDDELTIEVKTNRNISSGQYLRIHPSHVCHLGEESDETIIECKPIEVE